MHIVVNIQNNVAAQADPEVSNIFVACEKESQRFLTIQQLSILFVLQIYLNIWVR